MVLGGVAFLGGEGHQPAIAPGAAFGQLIAWQDRAALRVDLTQQGIIGPLERPVLTLDRLVQGAVAPEIVRDAVGRVEIDGLERAHERPPEADPGLDRGVDVGGRGDAVLDHAQRRAEQRRLHAVGDEALDLLVQPDRRLADPGHEVMGALDHGRIGPRCRAQLDQGRHERRVDRMRDQAAVAARDVLGEARRRDARGRAREDRLRAGETIELGVHLALDLDPLRHALLDVGGAGERLGEPGGVADPPEHRMRILDQPEAGEIGEPRRDGIARRLERRRLGIVQHDLVAGPAEHDRPGLTDQAAADQRDPFHGASLECLATPARPP